MIPYILTALGGFLIGGSIKQYGRGGKLPANVKKFIELQDEVNRQIDEKGEADHELADELNRIGDSLNSYESELAIEEYMKRREPVRMAKEVDKMQLNVGYNYAVDRNVDASGTFEQFKEDFKKKVPKSAKFSEQVMKAIYYSLQQDWGKMAKGGAVKRFVEMKGDKPVYALADAIYHVSFGTLNDKGFPVTTGTHKVYRTASGLKKIKEYKNNPEYSVLEEKTDDKGIWHITFVANKSFMMDGKETKDVVSFDRDDLYANGGMTGGKIIEDEIFEAINKIYSDPNNKDRYGQVSISEYTEYKLKKMLSDSAFDYLKSGKSAYGKFSTYGGRLGTYSALSPTSEFYQRKRMKADGGMMAKGGIIRKGSYFHVLKGMDGIKRFRVKDIEGNKVITEYTKNDGTIVTNNNEQKDNLEWLLENGHIKKVTEKEYWDKKHNNYSKGGTIEEQLEKIDVYNDLDEYEYRHYIGLKKHSDLSKVDALKIIINDAEGDISQLSKKLASIAKKIKYADGGRTEPKLPHRYKIGDKVTFMNADYSTGRGKIVKQEVRYINMNGYNLYLVELDNGKINPVAESDILDDYSKNRKFYNPD